jgi:hypothetical protein
MMQMIQTQESTLLAWFWNNRQKTGSRILKFTWNVCPKHTFVPCFRLFVLNPGWESSVSFKFRIFCLKLGSESSEPLRKF